VRFREGKSEGQKFSKNPVIQLEKSLGKVALKGLGLSTSILIHLLPVSDSLTRNWEIDFLELNQSSLILDRRMA